MFISTSRKPLQETLNTLSTTQIKISNLSTKESQEFIQGLLGNKKLSPKLLSILIQRTEGIPLFIEEMTKMLVQKELIEYYNGVMDFKHPDHLNEVPETLRESLQQKLDTLYIGKETARLAATIGREFDFNLLESASSFDKETLQLDIEELLNNDLIFKKRRVDGDHYIFKHALVRDAAYEGQTPKDKITSHLSIAEAMVRDQEKNKKDSNITTLMPLSNHDYEIAEHYANANEYQKAIERGLIFTKFLSSHHSSLELIKVCETIESWIQHLDQETLKNQYILDIYQQHLTAEITVNSYASAKGKELTSMIRHQLSSGSCKLTPQQKQILCDKMDSLRLFVSLLFLSIF